MRALIAGVAVLAALAAMFLVARSPGAPPGVPEAEIARIQTEVMATTDAFAESWNAHDVDGFLSIFHPEKVSHAWGARVWKDHDALADQWREVWQTSDSLRVSWVNRTVRVLTDAVASFQGSTDLTIYYGDGRILHYPGTAHWTGLFEPAVDGWKMTTSAYTFGGAERLDDPG